MDSAEDRKRPSKEPKTRKPSTTKTGWIFHTTMAAIDTMHVVIKTTRATQVP